MKQRKYTAEQAIEYINKTLKIKPIVIDRRRITVRKISTLDRIKVLCDKEIWVSLFPNKESEVRTIKATAAKNHSWIDIWVGDSLITYQA